MRRVAIVTGASAGIGRATARRLAEEGYSVVLTARRADRLTDLENELSAKGSDVLVIPGDIADPSTCKKVVDRAAEWGRIEVLVANAGFGYSGPFDEMPDDTMQKMVEVNVYGVFRSVRLVIPHMRFARENGKARIVIVGSVLSRIATSGNAVYCATKHALVGFADSLRQELCTDGISVISILPGYTDTEFLDAMPRRETKPSTVEALRKLKLSHSAEDVADLIAYRVRHPSSESVVGFLNTTAVLFATRFPGLFYSFYGAAERAGKGDFRRLQSLFRKFFRRRDRKTAEVISFNT